MKKSSKIMIFIITAVLATSTAAFATEVPRESAPENATEENIVITENLIGGILDEVQNGLGYADARNKANNKIFNAVIANETNGLGYGILSSIASNAIFSYRDIYLRPDYYKEAEEKVKVLIADIITEVEKGKDYTEARKDAYTRIYQSVNPSFNPETLSADFCYWDIPAVDSALFNRARKLLLEAQARRLSQ